MSKAQDRFDENAREIARLLEIHQEIAGSGPGRKHDVEVLNKSAIVLITSFWEAFCEDLAEEGLEHLVQHAKDASALPDQLKKDVASELKQEAHGLAVWKIADGNWRQEIRNRMQKMTEQRNRKLNTPKTAQINQLFLGALGLEKVSAKWQWSNMSSESAGEKLDRLVSLRGSIAHRGVADDTVYKADVKDYQRFVGELSKKTTNTVSVFVSTATGVPMD